MTTDTIAAMLHPYDDLSNMRCLSLLLYAASVTAILSQAFAAPPATVCAVNGIPRTLPPGFGQDAEEALQDWARSIVNHPEESQAHWYIKERNRTTRVAQAWVSITAGRHGSTLRAAAGSNPYASTMYPHGRQKAASTNSLGEVFSVTKTIAAVCMMKLWESRAFELDDPLTRYVPELEGVQFRIIRPVDMHPNFLTSPEYNAVDPHVYTRTVQGVRYRYYLEPTSPITVRQVLSNSAGIVSGKAAGPMTPIKIISNQLQVEAGATYERATSITLLLTQLGLANSTIAKGGVTKIAYVAFKPGRIFSYHAFHLVPRLAELAYERATGACRHWEQVLDEVVLRPLGMRETFYYIADNKLRTALNRQFMPRTVTNASARTGWSLSSKVPQRISTSAFEASLGTEHAVLLPRARVEIVSAATGLVSSTDELSKLLAMLANVGWDDARGGRFLRTSTVRLMFEPQAPIVDTIEARSHTLPPAETTWRQDNTWGLGIMASVRPLSTAAGFVGEASDVFSYLESFPKAIRWWQGINGVFFGVSLEDGLYFVSQTSVDFSETMGSPDVLRDEIMRARPLAILYDHMLR